MGLKLKSNSVIIDITFEKIILWISGMWLFFMTILNACKIKQFNTDLFKNKDNGVIILITIFLFIFVTTFVKHKIMKLISGLINIIFSFIIIIGAFITSVTSISTWMIFSVSLIAIIASIFWILKGLGIKLIKNKNKEK